MAAGKWSREVMGVGRSGNTSRGTVFRVIGPVEGKVQLEAVEIIDPHSPYVQPWKGRIRLFFNGKIVVEREIDSKDAVVTR